MARKHLLVGVTVLAIVAAAARLYLNWPGRAPRIQLDSYQALGEVAARETARVLNQKGQVVIIARENRAGANPAEAAQLKAFSRALKDRGGVSIAATATFTLTPLEQMSAGGSVPRGRFLKVLQDHPKATALVLFAGLPELEQPDLDRLARSGLKLVVISGYRPGYKQLLEAGVIHVAIVPRLDSPPEDLRPPQNLEEWFERDYMLVTPAQAPGLPY